MKPDCYKTPLLMHGDCMKLMYDIPNNSVDMICCDMPYGITSCKWDSILPLDMVWHHYRRVLKDKGAIVLFSAQPFTTTLISSNLKGFAYQWIWEKTKAVNHLNAYKMPMRKHEDILVFSENGKLPFYSPQILEKQVENIRPENKKMFLEEGCYGKHGKNKKRKIPKNKTMPNTMLKFTHDTSSFHPTQKPVALLEYLIKTYSNENDVILDNCMGSGTTGVACKKLKRKFIGIELGKINFRIAKNRIKLT